MLSVTVFSRSLVPLRRLHVQFFGDNGRRSWLSSSAVMNYTGKEAFDNLAKSILSGVSSLAETLVYMDHNLMPILAPNILVCITLSRKFFFKAAS